MNFRILKKALGLLIVDIVIIIGIFVLQFRTDSTIIKKIGNLQITLETQNEQNGIISYKNKARISYNGINFFFDEQNPASIKKDNRESTVVLQDVVQNEELSITLNFSEDVKVTFELASADLSASLAILTDLPDGVSDFSMPYSYSSNMTVQKVEKDSIVFGGKRNAWELSGHSVRAGYFDFTPRNYVATYSVYNADQKFTFEDIVNEPIANAAEFSKTIAQLKRNLISAFESNNVESNITEQVAVSFVAAQAESGNYNRAVEMVPDSLKKSRQRTYLSAPYFNTLEDMNVNLEKAMKDYERRIADSADRGSFDLFTVHKIADFIYLNQQQNSVTKLLNNVASADMETLTIAQISGIIQVYTDLAELSSSYAAILEPVLEAGIERITDACKFEGNILTISENDTFLSVNQAVETGIALLRYGKASANETLEKAGYAIINSYLSESSSFDLRTLSNLYAVLAYDNIFYPHFEKVDESDGKTIWAWTCAKSIRLNKTKEEYSFTIDFPEGDTHYIILKGIPPFNSIYIYDMAFRTDPRFETYNSSGYVYKRPSETLLLKSRHKTEFEKVRLVYKESKPAPAPVVEETPAPAAEESEPVEEPAETESTETEE
ncbi:hypothetical protein [Treponema bryantii]|uniref:hypothetical protein n=1 Tax=Treponema bryantii TaxID=163 RepID=UPI0003B5F069|nr:hypothetical protein [Treponema bryantii]